MATYSSILAWRIPWTEKTGGLQSMGSQRVGHGSVTDTFTSSPSSTLALKIQKSLSWERICLQCRRPRFYSWVGKIPWRRKWQPTPVFLPGESHGQRSLVGYSPWGCKELDTTEATEHTHMHKLTQISQELGAKVKQPWARLTL